jgi:hypothetical protein
VLGPPNTARLEGAPMQWRIAVLCPSEPDMEPRACALRQ